MNWKDLSLIALVVLIVLVVFHKAVLPALNGKEREMEEQAPLETTPTTTTTAKTP
jgi:hypothetical protein